METGNRAVRVARTRVALLLTVLGACSLGCGGADYWHARNPPYTDGFYNATGQELRDVQIDYEVDHKPYRLGGGLMVPTAVASIEFAPDPIPERVTLSWRTPDGELHHQELAVASRVPDLKHFSGTLYFCISQDGLRVVPVTYDEEHRNAVRGIRRVIDEKAKAVQPDTQPSTRPSTRPD